MSSDNASTETHVSTIADIPALADREHQRIRLDKEEPSIRTAAIDTSINSLPITAIEQDIVREIPPEVIVSSSKTAEQSLHQDQMNEYMHSFESEQPTLKLSDEIINQKFAEIVESLQPDSVAGREPVPEVAPDAEAMKAVAEQIDARIDTGTVLEQIDSGTEIEMGVEIPGLAEYAPAEVEELSAEDLEILAQWTELIETSEPEDFAVSPEDTLSINADYQEILEPIDIVGMALPEVAPDTLPESLQESLRETLQESLQELSPEPPLEVLQDQAAEQPAEAIPTLTVALEQITERVAMLEPQEVAETHALLAVVSHELQVVEKIVQDPEAIAGSVREVEEAEAVLVQSIQRLCEHIGLDYSEEQITRLVQQLLEQQVGTINLRDKTATGSAEINQIDLNTGTHETLSWFLSSIKQLKKQTNWLHLHLLMGRQIMASFPDVFAV